MYKKIISVMSVMLVVFLCINYDVKADEVIDSSRRYNWLSTTQHYGNIDVTGNLFCLSDNPAMQSVNLSSAEYVGGGTTQSVVSTWESVYLWKFQATYVLKNTGDTYETFDNGRLYSQFSVTAKASSSSSGSGSLTDDIVPSGWYIDNIQGATLTNALSDGTMYWSVDDTYYGNTLIIAPGQSITFSYDINIFWWEQSFGVGGTSFSCQNGSISNTIGYTQNGGYNSYSVYEFITDYPFPSVNQYIAANIDSIWTLVTQLANNQIITNNELTDIFNAIVYTGSYAGYSLNVSGRTSYTDSNNNVDLSLIVTRGSGLIYDNDIYYNPSTDTSNVGYSVKYPLNYTLLIHNNNDYSVILRNGFEYFQIPSNFIIEDTFGDFYPYRFNDTSIRYYELVVPANSYAIIGVIGSCTYTGNNLTTYPTIASGLYRSGNFVSYDPNNQENSMIDNVHSQEQNWFNQGNQSIGSTGINNYQFNAEQSGGISGVSNDFVRVWNACGSLNSVWIFSLTLSLALYIIHHVPKQRS